ncbi:MAG: serine hydrolase [Roseivirga sp.]|nr:serine hydrolase [Roseivirga sp.]
MKPLFALMFGMIAHITVAQSESILKAKIDSIATAKIQEYQLVGLSVGVVKDNEVFFTKGYGTRQLGTDKPVTESSIFHAASVSKLFTALAVMELMDEKGFSLDTPVTDIVPNLNFSDNKVAQISVEQILNHTSGLPDVYNYDWKSNHQEENSLRNYFNEKKLKTRNAPGTNYAYSNLAYDLLGLVVEELSGQSFEDYVKQNLLTPAGMKHSDFRHFLIPEGLRTRPHTMSRVSGKISERTIYPYNREHAPSSTLNASAQELSLWMSHFLRQLDGNSLHQQMLENSTEASEYIGLGFHLNSIHGFKAVGHFGGDQGFRSALFMIPEKQTGIVVLGNVDYKDDFRQELILAISKVILEAEK